jgi:hypothetical protein
MKLIATLLSAALPVLTLAAQAHAQVTTISQPTKFPVEIKSRGSYRLIGNLRVLSPNQTAISITAVGPVTIDLNGFSILGPVTCSGSPITCAPSGSGVGINASAQSIVSIFNGTVTGMGGVGISLNGLARVRDVSVISNGGGGISTGTDSVVSSVSASDNGGDGILTGGNSVVSGSSATNNGGNGINGTYKGAPGVTVSASTAGGNKGAGILADTVFGSSADSNGDKGIAAVTVAASTAASNTVTGILAIIATGSTMRLNQGDGFEGFLLVDSSSLNNGGHGAGPAVDFAFDMFNSNTAGSLAGVLDRQLGTSDCNTTVPCP